ncbi:MAG TPA: sugar ABC transporter permease [Limnochordia bacterium]|jgi:multiple sugar transport system permease protein|nr:sugar ABC transporter permease [Limnochordia bacterium]
MRSRWKRLGNEQTKTAFLALLPSFVLFSAFTVYPIFYSLYLSFFNASLLSPMRRFVGLDNYVNLLQNPTFQKAVKNTILYTIGVVPVGIALSLIVAVLLNKKLRFRGFFRAAFFAPVITSMVAVSIVWTWMLEPNYGLINGLLAKIGIAGPGWLTDPSWALTSVILLSIWKNLGFNMVIFLAGLQNISPEINESADMDGVSAWQRLRYITIPMMRGPIGFAAIVSMIKSMQVFGQVYVMTGGGPANSTMVIVYYLYQQAFEFYRSGYASAIAWVLFIGILVLTLIQNRMLTSQS